MSENRTAEQEIAELKRQMDTMAIEKKAISLGVDHYSANGIAKALYGATDPELALVSLWSIWDKREKEIRKNIARGITTTEPRRIQPSITKTELDAMGYKQRLDFALNHPDEYEILMGRA